MVNKNNKVLINNTIYMYILSFAKLIIPLISLPYLTRVLSVNAFGSVSFIKSIISYLQIIIDFGFIYSATKDIVKIIDDKKEVSKKVGSILYSQILLSIFVIILTIISVFAFDIFKGFELFVILSVVSVILSIFLFEYVFRAYEQMGKIAIRFVVMKIVALILTLIFVKSDKNIILIPLFDVIASVIAVVMVGFQLKKLGVSLNINLKDIHSAWINLKNSFIYFITNFIATAFSLLNTILIGIILTSEDVAYWTVAMQFLTAIYAMYNPILSSVYPNLLKNKNLKIVTKIMLIYIPIIIIGCIIVWFYSDSLVTFVFGDKYLKSSIIILALIPVFLFSFPSMLYSWPCMSALNLEKCNSLITIILAILQIIGISLLIIFKGEFTLINLALLKGIIEFVSCLIRMVIVYCNRKKLVEK